MPVALLTVPCRATGSAPKVLLTITVKGSSSQRWAGSEEEGVGRRASTALLALLLSFTPLHDQLSEYIAETDYRACPIECGERGWAGKDALGECWKEAPCTHSSHPASP